MATATQTAPPPSIAHRVVNDEPISVEEYLRRERERKTGERFEYVDGWVLAMHAVRSDEEIDTMTGPTPAHNIAVSNVSGGLRERLRNDECRAVAPSPRVAIPALDAHLYPDLLILCESPEIENDHRDTITNPQVIVEVLSPSTMDYDRGENSPATGRSTPSRSTSSSPRTRPTSSTTSSKTTQAGASLKPTASTPRLRSRRWRPSFHFPRCTSTCSTTKRLPRRPTHNAERLTLNAQR